jgi:BirA family biotin operon repressor/biotin-[acetyl-CoA-carboxylase] ligase
MGQKLIYVPECHSTNSLLNELNDKSPVPEGTILITHHQTAGRGQRGSRWEAEPGMNLTFSVLFRPSFLQPKDQFQLNMAVSLAVKSALQPMLTSPVKLKWPNDVFVDEKKVGGILIESQLQGTSLAATIVGIGININQQKFSAPRAASLAEFTGTFHDLNTIFQVLIESLELEYLNLRAHPVAGLKDRYLASLYKFREIHQFEAGGENLTGTICDVDESGRLFIETSGIARAYSFKEVKF